MYQLVERLEPRTLLAGNGGGVFDLTGKPLYKPTSADIADVKHGPMGNAGGALINIYLDYRRARKSGREFENPQPLVMVHDQSVGVTLRTTTKLSKFVRSMRALGMQISAQNEQFSVVQGLMPIDRLREVAARTDVMQMRPIYKPQLRRRGVGDNQADRALNADLARLNLGLTGAGVKVGVLSDSVNRFEGGLQDSVTSGDLPNGVQVVDDPPFAASDEGRAMLELIHDIAPGAGLAFATASGGQQVFAAGIRNLEAVGAKVIVDDIGYPDEPFFQEGVIDSAMRDVVRKGAVYLEATGNDADNGYQQTAQFTDVGGRTLMDFDPGPGIDTRLTVDAVGDVLFQWDNPYNGITGSASTDLDITFFRRNTNTVRASGLDDNLASGAPIEILSVPRANVELEIEVAQREPGTPLPTTWRMIVVGTLRDPEHDPVNRATAWGHSASNAGISVAAAPFFNAPPFSSSPTIATESFTSHGPGTFLFDPDGNRLNKTVTTQKPDITGIDAVNTSFFGGDIERDGDVFPNFFGTSAAAPNVAAVVALAKQANPALTQAEILEAMKLTGRPVNGEAKGQWNERGGFGLVDANAFISTLIKPPTAKIADQPDRRTDAVDTIKISFNQPVNGFTTADLSLTRDGGPNLLGGGDPVETGAASLTTDDNITYVLRGLSSITSINGTYTLTLNAAGSGIINVLNDPLAEGASETWQKITAPPKPGRVTGLTAEAQGADSILLRWDNLDGEEGYTIVRADDEDFQFGRKTYQVDADVTTFLSESLLASTTYHYQIRAKNFSGNGSYSEPASATTKVAGDVVVDNTSSRFRTFGQWTLETEGSGFLGANYLSDGNAGKGDRSVRWLPNLAGSGDYFVYARWDRDATNATNAKYDVFYGPADNQRQTVTLNQRTRGGEGYVLLGKFNFARATSRFQPYVRLSNSGTNGRVVADAMRFLPAGPLNGGGGGGSTNRAFGHAPGTSFGRSYSGFGQSELDERDLLRI
jgi:hypothetical protein